MACFLPCQAKDFPVCLLIYQFPVHSICRLRSVVNFLKTTRIRSSYIMYLNISHTNVKGVNMARTKVHGYSAPRYLYSAPRYLYIFVARAVYGGKLIFTLQNVLPQLLHLSSRFLLLLTIVVSFEASLCET